MRLHFAGSRPPSGSTPTVVVRRMINSEYIWWVDSDDDRMEIIKYLETLAPEEAEKEKDSKKHESLCFLEIGGGCLSGITLGTSMNQVL